jgi:hypothetical protein
MICQGFQTNGLETLTVFLQELRIGALAGYRLDEFERTAAEIPKRSLQAPGGIVRRFIVQEYQLKS